MGTYDETDKLIADLHDWMAEMGTDLRSGSCLQLVKSRRAEEGRCVLATRDVEFNQELVHIPAKFIFNFRFVLQDAQLVQFIEWATSEGAKLTRLDGCYLFLVVQRLDTRSRLFKFVESMPKSYDTPEYFDSRLVQMLPDCLRADAVKRIDRLKTKYALFKRLLDEHVRLKRPEDVKSAVSLLAEHLDFELFRWAFCTVNSRCFHIDEADICTPEELSAGDRLFGDLKLPETPATSFRSLSDYQQQKEREESVRNNLCCMIPYLDFLNHSFTANACGYYDSDKKAFVLRSIDVAESSDESVMFATDQEGLKYAIESGKQVYITYGHHDNKTLLLEYGFIMDENGNDRIDFSAADLTLLLVNQEADAVRKFEATLIANANYLSDLSCNKFIGPSWYLLKALNLVCSLNEPGEDPLNQQKRRKKKKSKAHSQNDEEISAASRLKIGQLFGTILEKYQQNLKDSLENMSQLSADVSAYHVEMSRKFCAGFLDIVDFNLNLVQNHDKWLELF